MSWMNDTRFRLVLVVVLTVLVIANVVDREWVWAAFGAALLVINLGSLYSTLRKQPPAGDLAAARGDAEAGEGPLAP